MDATLDAEVERLIHDLMETGRYRSREAVLEDAVRALAEREAERFHALKAHIQTALDDPRPRLTDEQLGRRLDVALDDLDRELASRRA